MIHLGQADIMFQVYLCYTTIFMMKILIRREKNSKHTKIVVEIFFFRLGLDYVRFDSGIIGSETESMLK